MKKLFFLVLLMSGLFVSVDAQNFEYVVYNASATSTWDFKVADANGNVAEELNIMPGEQRNGVFFNFGFLLEWKGVNDSNCSFYNNANGAVPETTVPVLCTSSASYTYKVVQVGLNDWVFKIALN
ncbi:MAG: hypothetical protein AAFZ15_27070 [Bacteroidota bacterium]